MGVPQDPHHLILGHLHLLHPGKMAGMGSRLGRTFIIIINAINMISITTIITSIITISRVSTT